jgi:hypothetical protein
MTRLYAPVCRISYIGIQSTVLRCPLLCLVLEQNPFLVHIDQSGQRVNQSKGKEAALVPCLDHEPCFLKLIKKGLYHFFVAILFLHNRIVKTRLIIVKEIPELSYRPECYIKVLLEYSYNTSYIDSSIDEQKNKSNEIGQ